MVFSEIEAVLSIGDRLKKRFSGNKKDNEDDTVPSRFIQLFEKHGIHRNQIPRFFGHGIQLDDISSKENLLPKLTQEVLESACKLFGVRLEWLEGADNQIYEIHNFYKQPERYADFLKQLDADGENQIIARLVLSTDTYGDYDALLVLEEEIGYIGDETVDRYHLCGGWLHKYWKARADLATCVAITLKKPVFMHEKRTPSNIHNFCKGEGFIFDLYNLPLNIEKNWFFKKRFKEWHPDSWIYDPVSFLEGVTEGDFGKASALARWLHYFDKGLMETGYHRENARAEFATLLKKYKS